MVCAPDEVNSSRVDPMTVDCMALDEGLPFFYPGTFHNGTYYDLMCVPVHGNGTNNTLLPACDCDEQSGTCVMVDCDAQCGNATGAYCNATTHLCECEPCTAPPSCKVAVCHVTGAGTYNLLNISCSALATHLGHGDLLPGTWKNATVFVNASCIANGTSVPTPTPTPTPTPSPPGCNITLCHYVSGNTYTLMNVSCAAFLTHLGHGDVLPNTWKNATSYMNATCVLNASVPLPPPAMCDCNPQWGNCTLLDCVVQCPNGGHCNSTSHMCVCDPCEHLPCTTCSGNSSVCDTVVDCAALCPNGGYCDANTEECICDECPYAPPPSPECGNGVLEDGEECDLSAHCLTNCTLPRPAQYCAHLICTTVPPQSHIDMIDWLTVFCHCANETQRCIGCCDDQLEDGDGDDQLYNRTVVCPATLYDNTNVGYWLLALLLFALISALLALAGSAA